MADQPYEILLRWKDDGTFSGGHTIRRDATTILPAQPIGDDTEFPWRDVGTEIDTAALAEVEALKSERDALKTERDTLAGDKTAAETEKAEALEAQADAEMARAIAEAGKAVLAMEKAEEEDAKERLIAAAKDDAVTEEEFQAIVAEEERPRIEKQKAELQREIGERQARLDELNAIRA